jgi:hypothetical protein
MKKTSISLLSNIVPNFTGLLYKYFTKINQDFGIKKYIFLYN